MWKALCPLQIVILTCKRGHVHSVVGNWTKRQAKGATLLLAEGR